jgi:endonuclease/exonuclease/phosphatase family metal-dependent hydrolase
MALHVMTYNILDGGEKREAYILDVLQAATPDILILQEVFTEDVLRLLSQSLKMNFYMGARNKGRKVALLSRLPVLAFKSYPPRFPMWRNFVDAEIEYEPQKTVRIVGVHPIANLSIIFEIWRRWEMKHVVKQIQDSQNMPCLIAGDFNAIAPGDQVIKESMPGWLRWMITLQGNRVYHFSIGTILSAGFTDCFRLLHSDEGFTLPPPKPNARLDYIFANARMKVYLKKCWVVRTPNSVNLASDHYPVMAEFDFTM